MNPEDLNLNPDPRELAGVPPQPQYKPLVTEKYNPVEEKRGPFIYNKKQKKDVIKAWNEKPENKANKIKAVSGSGYGFLKFLAFLGVLALLGIAVASGIFAYYVYQDGTLSSPVELICGNTTCGDCSIPTIPACPTCPANNCPACENNCKVNCPEIIGNSS